MSRRIVLLLAALAAFLAIILIAALRRQPPEIPADSIHLRAHGQPDACLICHGAGGPNPRSPNHPLGRDCWSCHFRAGEPR